MRALYLPVLFLLLSVSLHAQVGIGTEQPNTRAVLDLRSPSNNQGFLAPRLNTAQRTAPAFLNNLTAAENGLLVFDTDDLLFYYWMFPAWKALEAGTSSTIWRTGVGAPDAAIGEDGDFYLDTVAGYIHEKVSGTYVLRFGIKGEKGEKGDKGDKGDQGLQGIQGLPGETGAQGPQGLKGDVGATGAIGPQGLQGIQGLPGETGTQGPQGLKGDVGTTGAVGPQGPQGPQGVQGPAGTTLLKYREIKGPDQATKDDDVLMAIVDDITIDLPSAAETPGKVLYFRVNQADRMSVIITTQKTGDFIFTTVDATALTLSGTFTGVTMVSNGNGRWIVISTM